MTVTSMQLRRCQTSISISELRAAPAQAFERADEQPLMVLHRNKPAGYIVSPEWMQRMLDRLADQVITSKALSRVSDAQANSARMRCVRLDNL